MMPDGREYREGNPSEDVLMGLWLLVRDIADNNDVRRQLAAVATATMSADNMSDLVDDLIRTFHLLGDVKGLMEHAGAQPAIDDRQVETVFTGLGQVLGLTYWWQLGDTEWLQKSQAARQKLEEIQGRDVPNWEKILLGCEFVAAQGGEHYHDRSILNELYKNL